MTKKHSSLIRFISINYDHKMFCNIGARVEYEFLTSFHSSSQLLVLGKNDWQKITSLLWYDINYECKRFCNIGARVEYEFLASFHSSSRLLDLPANIRPKWKWQKVTNTLAYYGTELITTVKSFVTQGLGVKATEI
jgi:hypothetical protein